MQYSQKFSILRQRNHWIFVVFRTTYMSSALRERLTIDILENWLLLYRSPIENVMDRLDAETRGV